MARRLHPMESGERDRLIALIPQVESAGASRYPVMTDGTPITLYASKSDIGGRERLAADQLSAPYTTRWEVNYREDIDPDLVNVPKLFKLVYQGRRFDIQSASMIGRKEGVEFLTLARMG
jgi:hypothetical protein